MRAIEENRAKVVDAEEGIEIDLRHPPTAALLAWLWPGAGHLYQRRHAKGMLFMACILTTYFIGLWLGDGRVVYASWQKHDRRWQYLCQIGAGLPALPALVQTYLVRKGKSPLFGGLMAPPAIVRPDDEDDLAQWHKRLSGNYDLGTVYTMIAGLLNVLAICDAYAGPFLPPAAKEERQQKDRSPPA